MPAPIEYHHLVQLALDGEGLQAQVLDMDGSCRERFSWPPEPGKVHGWRFRSTWSDTGSARLLLAGRVPGELFDRVRVSLDGWQPRLHVALGQAGDTYPQNYPQVWTGPQVACDPLDISLLIYPDLGPGGVLARVGHGPFSSLQTDAAEGYSDAEWPEHWQAGEGIEVSEV